MKFPIVRGILVIAWVWGPGVAMALGQNLVSNPSFETPAAGATFVTRTGSMGAWAISGNVDHIGGFWAASSGTQSVDLNGGDAATITQDLATAPGQAYTLSYDVSENFYGYSAKTMDVLWNGVVVRAEVIAHDATRTPTNMRWSTVSLSVTAAGATSTLAFRSTTGPMDGIQGHFPYYGPAIDNVVVIACVAPTVLQHPSNSASCPVGSAGFMVVAGTGGAESLRWQLETAPEAWINAVDGALPYNGGTIIASGVTTDHLRLSLHALPGAPPIRFRCVLGNSCGSVTSNPATLTILSVCCPADLDDGSGTGAKDGGVDINDLLYFLTMYEAGLPPADLDDGSMTGTPDGAVTIDDLLFFLAHYEAGC